MLLVTTISDRMRRSSSYLLSLAAAVILLLVLTATEAEGIRLDADTRASVNSSSPIVNVSSDFHDYLIHCLNLNLDPEYYGMFLFAYANLLLFMNAETKR
jgi:hypothetical protein